MGKPPSGVLCVTTAKLLEEISEFIWKFVGPFPKCIRGQKRRIFSTLEKSSGLIWARLFRAFRNRTSC